MKLNKKPNLLTANCHAYCSAIFLLFLMSAPAYSADWLYTVKPGDTLWDICIKYTSKSNCWVHLGPYNGVTFPKRLPPGQIIKFPVNWLRTQPTPVKVLHVKGDAKLSLPGSTNSTELVSGARLPIGSLIETGRGNATLEFGDGSTLLLESHSELLLDSMSSSNGTTLVDSRLRLNKGTAKTKVVIKNPPSRFIITTPAAVAAVRGTEFRVSYNKQTMRSEVFHGLVNIATSTHREDVPAGFGIVAQQGRTLEPPKQLLVAPRFLMPDVQLKPATIRWTSVPGAQQYSIELLTDKTAEELLTSELTSQQQYTIPSSLAINNSADSTQCFQVRVRAIDSQKLQGMASQTKICQSLQLETPQLSSDDIILKTKNTLSASWRAIPRAASYRIQVSKDQQFGKLFVDQLSELPHSNFTVKAGQVLFIRVQAISAEGIPTPFSTTAQWTPSPEGLTIKILAGYIALFLLL